MKYQLAYEEDQLVQEGTDTYDPPTTSTNVYSVKEASEILADCYNDNASKYHNTPSVLQKAVGWDLQKLVHSINEFKILTDRIEFTTTHGTFVIHVRDGKADPKTIELLAN